MKRTVLAIILVSFTISAVLLAQPQKKKKVPCATSLATCPDQGCGKEFDPNLNRRKNIVSDNQAATLRTLASIKKLDDPEHFSAGDTREELTDLGEGQMITVAAYLIAAKPELSGESCNCGLQTPEETDNHLVLVSKTTVDKFPVSTNAATNKKRFHSRELESVTAEFTPRVRLQHPHFTRADLVPLINAATQKALFVRVTGLLLFDTEHFIKNHLVRVNNWEIHPVLKFEFCSKGVTCKATADAGWKSLDDLQ